MLSLHGATSLHTGHVANEGTQTWSHTGFPPCFKHYHLCLLVFMTKLEVSQLEIKAWPLLVEGKYFFIAPPICTENPFCLSGKGFRERFWRSRSSAQNPLQEWDKVNFQPPVGVLHQPTSGEESILLQGEVPCVELYFCLGVWQNWWQDSRGRWKMPSLK